MLFQLPLLLSTYAFTEAFLIKSDRITYWGYWGKWDQCPEDSFVKAINVKVEPHQGFEDDTALNAVHLSCVPLEYQVTNSTFPVSKVLNSSQGQWGNFTGLKYCYKGVAVGFYLRSEKKETGLFADNTAANDMKLICANRYGTTTTTETWNGWGSWGPPKRCPDRTAVCGLRTQVQSSKSTADQTSLNNVDLRCCKLPDPARICQPTDAWEVVFWRDNSNGTTPIKHKLTEMVGVKKDTRSSESSSVIADIAESVGFGGAAFHHGLGLNFEKELSTGTNTRHKWSRKEKSVFRHGKVETTDIEIPAGCATSFFQIVGKCGPYVVRSNRMRRSDKCVNGTQTETMGLTL